MAEEHELSSCDHHFVQDGYDRARSAIEGVIRTDVERHFATRLRTASFLKRWHLQREMKAEIERRIRARAPPDAFY